MSLIPNKDQEEMNRIFPIAKETALEQFRKCNGCEEESPLERLRFFCSLAMNDQDWLDSECFFDDIDEDLRK